MFYAAYRINGELHSNLYKSWADYYNDTFSVNTEHIALIEFKIHGNTYGERKNSLRETAINYHLNVMPGLSYGEILEIYNWFNKNGKRFGLLKEFVENGIC